MAQGTRPIAHEVALWLRELRAHWFQPVDLPLRHGLRFTYAFAGSMTWLIGLCLSERLPATTRPLSTAVVPDPQPRIFLAENYDVGSFLDN